jgi:hypothetical protein
MLNQDSLLAIATSVALGLFNPIASPVNAHDLGTAYISGAEQFPQGRATQVRQTIRLTLPTPNITQIKIAIPAGLKVGNNIALYNDTARKSLSARVRNNSDREIEIDLPQALAPQTKITIDLNSVRLWGLARTYQVYSQPIDNSSPTYLGSAEFHLY